MVMLVRRRAEKAERESSKARQALGAALIALSGYVPVITAQELNIDLDWARDALRPILEAATEHELREAERERDALRAALAAVASEPPPMVQLERGKLELSMLRARIAGVYAVAHEDDHASPMQVPQRLAIALDLLFGEARLNAAEINRALGFCAHGRESGCCPTCSAAGRFVEP